MRTLSLVIFLALATIAYADFPVSAPRVGPAHNEQTLPSIASNGSDYLAAWIDRRGTISTAGLPYSGEEPDVYTTRIGIDGSVSPDGGVAVTPTLAMDGSTAVIPCGDHYVVAKSMFGLGGIPGGLVMTRVTGEGPTESHHYTTEDLGGTAAGYGARVSAAWNGSVYLVVVSPRIGSGFGTVSAPISAVLIDDSFHIVKRAFDLGSAPAYGASVATDGRDFVVTWIDRGDVDSVRVARITADGTLTINPQPLGTFPFTTDFDDVYTAIAWGGDRYLAAWPAGSIRARPLDREAAIIGDDVIVATSAVTPSIAWNGSTFLIAYATNGTDRDVRAVALGGSTPIDVASGAGLQRYPTVASAGGTFAIAFQDGADVRSTIVDVTTRTTTPSKLLARSLGEQRTPRGVFDGANFAFVWEEEGHVFFGRSTPSGALLDGPGIDLGEGSAPRIAFNGDTYLVVWSSTLDGSLHARRVNRDAWLLDAAPLMISSMPGVFVLASNGRDFLIVALTNGAHAIVVTNQGSVIPRSEAIDDNQSLANGSLAWNGARYALTYTRGGFLSHTPPEKRLTLFGSSGEVLVAPFTTPAFASPAFLAPGSGDVLAVYNTTNGIEARHINNVGTISDAVLIRECSCGVADVAWNGTDYFVVSGSSVFRIGNPSAISLPSDAVAFALTSGRGAIGIAYVRQQPLVAVGNPIMIFRANWELIPPRRARAVRP